MVQDATGNVVILAKPESKAFIDAIRILDTATGVWYAVFPENQQAQCTIGVQCWVNMRVRNIGTGRGNLYLKVTRLDTNEVVFDYNWWDDPQGYQDITNIGFIMPNSDLTLRFEIGHI
jgi:hypothetical protein